MQLDSAQVLMCHRASQCVLRLRMQESYPYMCKDNAGIMSRISGRLHISWKPLCVCVHMCCRSLLGPEGPLCTSAQLHMRWGVGWALHYGGTEPFTLIIKILNCYAYSYFSL